QLITSQARNQVLAVANRLRELAKACAVTEKVRTHGDHDVDGDACLRRCLEQQLDKSRSLIPGTILFREIRKAEDLLKLIDDDQQILMRLQARLAGSFDESQAAAPKGRLEHAQGRRSSEICV